MYERFTGRVRTVMQLADREARRWNHRSIGAEHILLGLVAERGGVAANVLENLGVDLEALGREVGQVVDLTPRGPAFFSGPLPHTVGARKVLEHAIEEARGLNHNYIGTEHLLLGLLGAQEECAAQILMGLGLKIDVVRQEVAARSRGMGDR